MPTSRIALNEKQAGFDPRLLPGLELWADARHPAGLGQPRPADGTPISSWADLGPVNKPFTAVATQEPLFYNAAGSDPHRLRWDNVNDRLLRPASNLGLIPATIYLVGNIYSQPVATYMFSCGATSNRFHILGSAGTGVMRLYLSTNFMAFAGSVANTWQVFTGMGDGVDTGYTSVNGAPLASATGLGSPGLTSAFNIPQNATLNSDEAQSAILVYTRMHDKATNRRAQEWLAKRTGITLARAA